MAVEVKFDLLGSTQTLGYTDFRDTKAVRRGQATGLLNNRNALRQAIVASRAELGQFHHNLSNLPLRSIQAVKFGKEKALLRANYRHSRFTVPFRDIPAASLIQTRISVSPTPVFRAWKGGQPITDFPTGPIRVVGNFGTDPNRGPDTHMWMRPSIRLYVSTVLDFDPNGIVLSKVGKTNSGPTTFGTITLPRRSVKFDGLDVNWNFTVVAAGPIVFPGAPSVTYSVIYKFTAVAGGWFEQNLLAPDVPDDSGIVSPFWSTFQDTPYPEVDFAGAFPVHL